MIPVAPPKVFGAGLIALDLVISAQPSAPVRSWAGGTCGNVLSILAFLGWDAYPIGRMGDDAASARVRSDMARWRVHLDWAACAPASDTPIIVQQIRRGRDGRPNHRFSWACPRCGRWLPSFKAVTANAADAIKPALASAAVFFMDRLSRATLALASEAAARGAVVVYEPSGKATDRQTAEAVALAHIVKYADGRLASVSGVMAEGAATLVEVQTLGERGLRFRQRLRGAVSDWTHMDAIPAPRLADTCGSGDWCTAGLIARTAGSGRAGLERASTSDVRAALRYGQALAAWNCGFEGARGGMYAVAREDFETQITSLLDGRWVDIPQLAESELYFAHTIDCPACPNILECDGVHVR